MNDGVQFALYHQGRVATFYPTTGSDIRETLSNFVLNLRKEVENLKLGRNDLLQIRQAFSFGWILLPHHPPMELQ
jgi:hypothetical protein